MFFYVGDVVGCCSGLGDYFDVFFLGCGVFGCGYYYDVGVFIDVIVDGSEFGCGECGCGGSSDGSCGYVVRFVKFVVICEIGCNGILLELEEEIGVMKGV